MPTIPEAPVPSKPNARRFEGKVTFITGAARGQGRAELLSSPCSYNHSVARIDALVGDFAHAVSRPLGECRFSTWAPEGGVRIAGA